MARLNLTAEDEGQKLILAYLEENASDSLVERINAGKKTMSGCWQYIRGRARGLAKNQCACVPDSEVFGWAVHYFEEDALSNETSAAKSMAIQEERLRQNEEKERIRKEEAERKAKEKEKEKAAEALRKIEEAKRKEEEARKEKERQKEEERKKKASGGIDGQLSLFDLLGGE